MRILLFLSMFFSPQVIHASDTMPGLQVSADGRYFQTSDGKPFFWLGDTGWLLFSKCSRSDVRKYLDTRKRQGFNVIQVMVIHELTSKNIYGDSALVHRDVSRPLTTTGADTTDAVAYDFWDHVDFVISEAGKRGIYMALVPVWGSNVKDGKVSSPQARAFAYFLARRYADLRHIIWLNGGDIRGEDGREVWMTIGKTIREQGSRQLMTFHPRGRTSSADWFHQEAWLDFNMFQSGHKTYAQDTSRTEKKHYGEDNWRYVVADRALKPARPVLDGEPSYENIPHGLHDSLQTRWAASDLRRYAYWSVFAGAAGFTYGENAVMQFNHMGDIGANFGVESEWEQTLHAPGATAMIHLKHLMLGRSFFDRIPAQEIIADNDVERYDRILATRGARYAFAYTSNGRIFKVDMDKLPFRPARAFWFDPKSGKRKPILAFNRKGIVAFDPPGIKADGNDHVLILEI